MDNAIQVYENNSVRINCTVTGTDSLAGYTSTLTVKNNINDTTAAITKTGTIVGLVISFDLLPADTVTVGSYMYDISVSDGTNNYTVIPPDEFVILETVKD